MFQANRRGFRDLERSEDVQAVVELAAERVRDKARQNARPITSDTDAIASTPASQDAEGVYADVGYDKRHPGFVLWFHEVGTFKIPANPHLRPAAASKVI